jgi:hypothetical protein
MSFEKEILDKINRLERKVEKLNTNERLGYTWLDWTPTVTYAGGTTDPTAVNLNYAKYMLIGDGVWFMISWSVTTIGSGDRTTVYFTYPVTKVHSGGCGSAMEDVTPGWTACNVLTQNAEKMTILISGGMSQNGGIYAQGFYRR